MNTLILLRCMHCMHIRKEWQNFGAIVFIPDTLKKYAEETCELCEKQGMELYIGEPIELKEQQAWVKTNSK